MTATNNTKTAPLYVQFAQALLKRCAEMGLEPLRAETETGFPQNEGYFFVRFGDQSSAAAIVPKSKLRMGNVHLHIDAEGLDGYIPLPKKNGKVICHFVADVDLLAKHILPRLPGARKRDTIVASKAPVSRPVETPVTDVFCGLADDLSASLSDGEAELEAAELRAI